MPTNRRLCRKRTSRQLSSQSPTRKDRKTSRFVAESRPAEALTQRGREAVGPTEEGEVARRRRRRRRRRGGERPFGESIAPDAPQPTDDGLAAVAELGGDLQPAIGAVESLNGRETRSVGREERPSLETFAWSAKPVPRPQTRAFTKRDAPEPPEGGERTSTCRPNSTPHSVLDGSPVWREGRTSIRFGGVDAGGARNPASLASGIRASCGGDRAVGFRSGVASPYRRLRSGKRRRFRRRTQGRSERLQLKIKRPRVPDAAAGGNEHAQA